MDSSSSRLPGWAELDEALDAALDLEEPERAAYVASLEASLRRALVPLLQAALTMDPVLDHPEVVLESLVMPPDGMEAGVLVGPYRLGSLVGEGGMGRVYRARRADGAFDKTVAVKLVRHSLSLAGSDVSARLRRERALLATLDHPGIARLIDGGETDDGVPYLVTEFIDGAPITTWADDHALGVRERVRLLAEVARAVDHAHRRFVIHRDLKPSNVLVTECDGMARPVVLDFGIAKALEDAEDATGAFPLTRTGMRLLTPAYAAPELFDPTLGVTVGADVYGLGTLLYELLTGMRPHGDATTAPAAEPTRPSKVVTDHAGTEPTSDTGTLARTLRGDLDVIALKALHPDPARRYHSAAALAEDLQRYLDGLPVTARPDSRAYVLRRFVRRNRTGVAAALVALLAVVGGAGASLVSLASKLDAQADTEAAAARATEAAELLAGLFKAADPRVSEGRTVSAREALDSGLDELGEIADPTLRGYLANVLGRTYFSIGDRALGDSLLAESVALLDRPGAPADLRNEALLSLAAARTQFESEHAAELFQRVYHDAQQAQPINHLLEGRALRGLALAHADAGRPEEGIEAGRQAVDIFRREGDDDNLAGALMETGTALASAGRGGVVELREAFTLTQSLNGPESFQATVVEERLAWALSMGEAYAEALPIYEKALAHNLRVLGPEHFSVALARDNIGHILVGLGRHREAVPPLRAALDGYRRHFPAPLPASATYRDLAIALNRIGQHADAEAAARAGLQGAEAEGSRENVLALTRQLGLALYEQARHREARPHLVDSFADTALPTFARSVDAAEKERARVALAALTR